MDTESKVSKERLEHADPCGFVDQKALADLGTVTFDDGIFYTDCTAAIDGENVLQVQAGLQLESVKRDTDNPWRETKEHGFTVRTSDEEDYGCEREIQVFDDVIIGIWASGGEPKGTVCEVADTAVDGVLDQLLAGEVRELDRPDDSLADQDACAVVTDEDAARAPEIDPTAQTPGFAGQYCTWGEDDVGKPGLYVGFTRSEPPQVNTPEERAADVAGRSAVMTVSTGDSSLVAGSLPSCEIAYVHQNVSPLLAEIVTVSVRNSGDPNASCPLAVELATKAAALLTGG